VIARTTAVIEAGGVLGELVCAPPLTLRQVRSDVRDRCELRLVGTAAAPLARDDLSVWLRLRPGARAVLRATGASVAQGRDRGQDRHPECGRSQDRDRECGRGQDRDRECGRGWDRDQGGDAAALAIGADLAEGAELVADPGALVVCQGSRIDVRVELVLAARAAVEWRELIVLGRTGEPPGRATLRWDVTRLGRPVLRQFVDLDPAANPGLTARAGVTGGRRVLACALICDPRAAPRTVVSSPTAVAQRIDDHTLLATVLADDAARATRQLDDLCVRARG
jgi:urease accessory protein